MPLANHTGKAGRPAGISLSRIAQLDQRTALPEQCLHSAEADVRPPWVHPILGHRTRCLLYSPLDGFRYSRPVLSFSTEVSMTNLYFEELEIGTRSAAGPYLVPKDEIIQFAKQYDPVPRHIDEEAAARSIFGGLTASSAHTFSIFILLTTRLQPRLHVLAGLGWDELRLPYAVRPGDELDLETTVQKMREFKSKPDRGIVLTQSSCATKGVKRCWSARPIFS